MASRPEEMAMDSDSDKREYTIILAGKLGVGKTSIFRRIQTGVFTEYPAASTGKSGGEGELENYIYKTTLDGMDYTVTLWDTGGLERYNSMTANYFRYCNAVILVYDSAPERLETLFALREWISDVTKHSSFSDKVVLSLWANKCDESSSLLKAPEVDAFMQEHHIPEKMHFCVSAKSGERLMAALHAVILQVSKAGHVINTAGDVSQNSGRKARRWRDRCRC